MEPLRAPLGRDERKEAATSGPRLPQPNEDDDAESKVPFSESSRPFGDVTLTGCNFARANLRGVTFLRCDLRGSTFERVRLGKNQFELAFFAGCTGLTNKQRQYIQRHGGTFTLDRPTGLDLA
jgi:hypothetical protein